ncbi:MAG: hypothetical protein U0232_10095 [Thermomicrobiales bacterium]
MSAAPLDPARFFSTDSDHGALLDRNGDGVPDDLRARIMVVGEPSVEEWCELIHLAARLGLETGAVTLPLGLTDIAQMPDGGRVLWFVAAGADDAPGADDGWVVRGAAELRALWGAGLDAGTATPAAPAASAAGSLDLAQAL